MTSSPNKNTAGSTAAEATARAAAEAAAAQGLRRQVGMMLRALRTSPVAGTLLILVLSVVVEICASSYGQITLNRWNKPFYDALSRRDLHDFLLQLGVFFMIAGVLLVLNVTQRFLVEMLKLKLREGIVHDLLRDWMKPRRAFWLANAGGPMGVNPDQRMTEDARKLCELSADLGAGLLQASILFGIFAGVLWKLSAGFEVRWGDRDYLIPGFMLWAAVTYAIAGSLLSYLVGRTLINRNAERYAREADLRFSMVRINEHLDGISLASGEEDERRRVEMHLGNVLAATRRLLAGLTNLTWVTAGFGWITIVAPILVAAPLYFSGKISFGGLMMAAAAFTQAQSSLRWFVDNFSQIADWRATLQRVASFRYALTTTEDAHEFESRIGYKDAEPGTFTIDNLQIVAPGGADMLKETHVVVKTGERVLIVGAPGTGKTLLFRALAGLWPWGDGCIARPKDEHMLYLPTGTPYLPRGTLKEVLAYPNEVARYESPAFTQALGRMGLDRLNSLLEETRRWDRELSQDEQVGLALARIVLQTPAWLLIDDMLGTLDDQLMERMLDAFAHELRQTSVIHIGRAAQMHDPLFNRVLHLVRSPTSPAGGVDSVHSGAAVGRT